MYTINITYYITFVDLLAKNENNECLHTAALLNELLVP